MNTADLIRIRLEQIEAYIARYGYLSYDPYDGLISPIPNRFFGSSQILLRIWQQAIRLSPIELRSLVGVHKIDHTKTISDFASTYALQYIMSGHEEWMKKSHHMLDWLLRISTTTNSGYGWGLRFPIATRYVIADETTLNSYQSVNAVNALLDGYEYTEGKRYLHEAYQGVMFLEKCMGYDDLGDRIIWTYWKSMKSEIHNINGLMLGMLSRMYLFTGENRFKELVFKLYRSICKGQNPDGSWYYSQDNRGQWVDGFHIGFILEGISRAILAGVLDLDRYFTKAVAFFKNHLFTEAGLPMYYQDSLYPIDVQNSAQAVQTHAFLMRLGLSSASELLAVVHEVDRSLWNPKGYYNHMKTKWWTYKTPMHRWGTGPMALALSYALRIIEEK